MRVRRGAHRWQGWRTGVGVAVASLALLGLVLSQWQGGSVPRDAKAGETRPPPSTQAVAASAADPLPPASAMRMPIDPGASRPLSAATPGRGLMARTPLEWYQQALLPTASVRDRIAAQFVHMACVESQTLQAQQDEHKAQTAPPLPASSPDFSSRELAWLRHWPSSAEQLAALQGLKDYCAGSEGFDYLAALRTHPSRSFEYFELAMASRPPEKRYPLLVDALSNPQTHALELRLWAEQDVREILHHREGFDLVQTWHAGGWLLAALLGDSDQVALYWQLQCARFGLCRSLGLLSEAERRAVEDVARRMLADLQRQDWPRVIYRETP